MRPTRKRVPLDPVRARTLAPNAHHITATPAGTVLELTRGETTRLRVSLHRHEDELVLDVREETLDERGRWQWSCRGIQLGPVEARALASTLNELLSRSP